MMTKYIGGSGATEVTVSGWKCNKCKRFYQGEGSSTAQFCCSEDRECEDCSHPVGCNWRVRCNGCQSLKDIERWKKYELVEWDYKTPLYDEMTDTYHFDEDSVGDHLVEHPNARLVLCEPNHGRYFELLDHLNDDLPEDGEPDPPKEVEAAINLVNEWLTKTVFSWSGGKKRVLLPIPDPGCDAAWEKFKNTKPSSSV